MMSSLSNSWTDWVIPLIAASGAAVIAIGLWLEEKTEKDFFRDAKELWSAKRMSRCGRKMVLAGVLMEFVLGLCVGLYERREVNPWNGKLLRMSADVYFEVKGTDEPLLGLAQLKWGNEGMACLCNFKPKLMPNGMLNGLILFPLYAFNLNSGNPLLIDEPAVVSNRSYSLEFTSEGTEAELVALGQEYPMKTLATAKYVFIGLHRLPKDAQILNGAVQVVATGTQGNVRRSFRIGQQAASQEGTWNVIIATDTTAK